MKQQPTLSLPAKAPKHAAPATPAPRTDILSRAIGKSIVVQVKGPSLYRGIADRFSGGFLCLRDCTEARWTPAGELGPEIPRGYIAIDRAHLAAISFESNPTQGGA